MSIVDVVRRACHGHVESMNDVNCRCNEKSLSWTCGKYERCQLANDMYKVVGGGGEGSCQQAEEHLAEHCVCWNVSAGS